MQNNLGINREQLKLIALLSMITDHFVKVFIDSSSLMYITGVTIGRISFPIFCYLFISSYSHVSNKKKQFILLSISALASEYSFYKLFNHHNIMITWLLVLIVLYVHEKVNDKLITSALCFILGTLSSLLNLDYGFIPFLFIVIYILIPNLDMKLYIPILTGLLTLEAGCILSIPIMYLYNQDSTTYNKKYKYLYYIIYPLHLLIFFVLIQFR